MLNITSFIPSTAVPGNQMETNESEYLISLSVIKGLPVKNNEIVEIFFLLNSFNSFIKFSLVFEKLSSSMSPSPSAYGVSPYTKIT